MPARIRRTANTCAGPASTAGSSSRRKTASRVPGCDSVQDVSSDALML